MLSEKPILDAAEPLMTNEMHKSRGEDKHYETCQPDLAKQRPRYCHTMKDAAWVSTFELVNRY